LRPDSDVEVVVGSCYRAGVKVDGPAPEQPVLDFIGFEQFVDAGQRGELFRLVHAVSLSTAGATPPCRSDR
jgi:hypothetical protein